MGERQRYKSSGFTYVELLTVLTIIMVLCGLVLLKFTNLQDNQILKNTSEQLMSDCFYARSLAEARGKTIQIKIYSKNCYRILDHQMKCLQEVKIDDRLALSGKDNANILFFSNGTTIGNTFCLQGKKTKKYIVVAQTGRIRVSDKDENI